MKYFECVLCGASGDSLMLNVRPKGICTRCNKIPSHISYEEKFRYFELLVKKKGVK